MKARASRLVTLAQQRGSTATTPAGAWRYLLRGVAGVTPLPIPDEATSRAAEKLAQYRASTYTYGAAYNSKVSYDTVSYRASAELRSRLADLRRAAKPITHRRRATPTSREAIRDARLLARYRAATRLPRYLLPRDRARIETDPSRRAILEVRTLPLYARALLAEQRGVASDVPAREWRRWDIARGELLKSDAVAADAVDRAPWGALRKRYPGVTTLTPGIRTETNGKWGWDKVSWHYADYTLIGPRVRRGAWSMYYVDPAGDAHRVYRTRHYRRIDRERIERVEPTRPGPKPLPVHVQRRILETRVPPVLRVEYDRAAKRLVLVDGWGEQYHVDVVASPADAERQVRQAVRSLRQRRGERLDVEQIRTRATSTWVTVDDSYEAGNCRTMTDRFAAEILAALGAEGPCAVRADVVLARRDDAYTRRAVAAAMTREPGALVRV